MVLSDAEDSTHLLDSHPSSAGEIFHSCIPTAPDAQFSHSYINHGDFSSAGQWVIPLQSLRLGAASPDHS